MNVENILSLADYLDSDTMEERFNIKFDMRFFFSNGRACIAGHAMLLSGHSGSGLYDTAHIAKKWLGLNNEQAEDLFLPPGRAYDASSKQAAKVLRHFVETGVIDWSRVD